MKAWRHILAPLGWIYQAITQLRNWAFARGFLSSKEFTIPVVAIGNLSTGGTGKTPMTEFVLRKFKGTSKAVVSRGYGRSSRGCFKVDPMGRAQQFGDEPLQIAQGFPDVQVWVSEKRVTGIDSALQRAPETELVVLDDAYQHRYVKAGFYLLLTTYHQPFYNDFVLPQGNLREGRHGAARAQAIVVTKCPPHLSAEEVKTYEYKIRTYSQAPVYFSSLKYGVLRNPSGETPKSRNLTVLTGIANPQPLLDHLKEKYQIKKHLKFKDHHAFSASEIKSLRQELEQRSTPLVTTQKDWVRLAPLLPKTLHPQCYVLPVEVSFLANHEELLLSQLDAFINVFTN